MNDKHEQLPALASLILCPDVSLEKAMVERKRVLSEMIGETLALARDAIVAHVNLDALVREGKRLWGKPDFKTDALEDIRLWCSRSPWMTPEYIRAFQLFYEAAIAGHAEAQCLVAECYRWGHGIPKSLNDEMEWLHRSAESGFDEAQLQLGDCYHDGKGVPQDYGEAAKWFRRAAEQGEVMAQTNLGHCYEYGLGVPKDYTEAIRWYREAAEQGYSDGQCGLGRCYDLGRGVPRNYPEAVRWLRKAVDQGNDEAREALAVCYANGRRRGEYRP